MRLVIVRQAGDGHGPGSRPVKPPSPSSVARACCLRRGRSLYYLHGFGAGHWYRHLTQYPDPRASAAGGLCDFSGRDTLYSPVLQARWRAATGQSVRNLYRSLGACARSHHLCDFSHDICACERGLSGFLTFA